MLSYEFASPRRRWPEPAPGASRGQPLNTQPSNPYAREWRATGARTQRRAAPGTGRSLGSLGCQGVIRHRCFRAASCSIGRAVT